MVRQAREVFLADGTTRATRDVVEDTGQVYGIENAVEVMVDTLLVTLVIVGRNDEQTVHTELLEAQAFAQRLVGRVGTRTTDDGDAPCHAIDHACGDLVVLAVGHRTRLARRAKHEDAVGTVCQMKVDESFERLKVYAPVLLERSDDRDDGSAQPCHVHTCPFQTNDCRRRQGAPPGHP